MYSSSIQNNPRIPSMHRWNGPWRWSFARTIYSNNPPKAIYSNNRSIGDEFQTTPNNSLRKADSNGKIRIDQKERTACGCASSSACLPAGEKKLPNIVACFLWLLLWYRIDRSIVSIYCPFFRCRVCFVIVDRWLVFVMIGADR